MNKSASIASLSVALSKAQAEMPSVKMNSVNPFLRNKFADLGAVIEASRPILAKHGLSVSQFPVSFDNRIGVTTILLHESGEYLEETALLQVEEEKGKSAAQVAGSIITYLRRYSWSAVLGLYADEDTDGGHTTKREHVEQKVDNSQPVKVEQTAGITVTPAWIVNNGYAKTAKDDKGKTAEAAHILNSLGLVGKPVEIAKVKIEKYWEHRAAGDDSATAAAKVIGGK